MLKYILLVVFLIVLAYLYWSSAILGTVEKFTVRFGDKEIGRRTSLKVNKALQPPYVQYLGAKDGANYTLMMTDPDAAKDDAQAYKWVDREWLLTEIPGTKLKKGLANVEGAAHTITPYIFNKEKYNHMHDIRLYEQPNKLAGTNVRDEPSNWDYNDFIDKHNLKLVGEKKFCRLG